MQNEIIKGITELSPFRQFAKVISISARATSIMKRTGQPTASRRHETGTRSETTGLKYGLEEITPAEMYTLIKVTEQNLQDTVFNLEGEIIGESKLAFAVAEGAEFATGNANGEAEGILTNAEILAAYVANGHATTLSADALIDLSHEPKSGYIPNSRWYLNRSTQKTVRKLKDDYGQYLWQPSYQLGDPPLLDGRPVTECTDMPDIASGAYPIAFGDLRQAYTIVDRLPMTVKRIEELYIEEGCIGFLVVTRMDAQVILPEAIKVLKMATS